MPVAVDTIAAAWPEKTQDSCADFFGTALRAAQPPIPANARVLEIGCAEYDWLTPAAKAWPEMAFTGIDWRTRKKAEHAVVIQGDVRTQTFAPATFDWIVSISAIEHIGLGHYGHDPLDTDGDRVTLAKCWDWLVPGGWLYFDVPYNPGRYQVVGTSHRIYDQVTCDTRLRQGRAWHERWSGIVENGDTRTLLSVTPQKRGGEDFYYIGFWWQKPGA